MSSALLSLFVLSSTISQSQMMRDGSMPLHVSHQSVSVTQKSMWYPATLSVQVALTSEPLHRNL